MYLDLGDVSREAAMRRVTRKPVLRRPVGMTAMESLGWQFGGVTAVILAGFVWFVWPKKKAR